MEFLAVLLSLPLIGLCYLLIKHNNKKVAEEKAAAEDAAAAARAQERVSALGPWIEKARSPADVLSLCDHRPPLSLRFQQAEQACGSFRIASTCERRST